MKIIKSGWISGTGVWEIVIGGNSTAEKVIINVRAHKAGVYLKGKPKVRVNGDGTVTLRFSNLTAGRSPYGSTKDEELRPKVLEAFRKVVM